MRKCKIVSTAVLGMLLLAGCSRESDSDDAPEARASPPDPAGGAYAFTMPDIDGQPVDLRTYRGNVALVVNTASECGFTPQYAGLEELYAAYRDRGFVVLAFPANNFGNQEPGTNAEIKDFCTERYQVSFPLFAKISVKGEDQAPLYRFLTDRQRHPEHGGPIGWNFSKFLIGKDGRVLARFDSKVRPTDPRITQAVESALQAG